MKYIKIELQENNLHHGKRTYRVTNKHDGDLIGHIGWFFKWKKFCFWPVNNTIFEEVCMRDIANFIEAETKKEKS